MVSREILKYLAIHKNINLANEVSSPKDPPRLTNVLVILYVRINQFKRKIMHENLDLKKSRHVLTKPTPASVAKATWVGL